MGLLYTILILFAYQGNNIVANVRPVFRVFVPLLLYFTLMWGITFFAIWNRSRLEEDGSQLFGYEMAVVQSFTAASNNFVSPTRVAIPLPDESDQASLRWLGIGDCCRHFDIWCQLAASTCGHHRPTYRGAGPVGVNVGRSVSAYQVTVGS